MAVNKFDWIPDPGDEVAEAVIHNTVRELRRSFNRYNAGCAAEHDATSLTLGYGEFLASIQAVYNIGLMLDEGADDIDTDSA